MPVIKVSDAKSAMARFIQLSALEYGTSEDISSKKHVEWKFKSQSEKQSMFLEMIESNEPNIQLGRVAIQYRSWNSSGQICTIPLPVDLLIHSGSRNVMTFMSLWRETNKYCTSNGRFWYHTSNPTSETFYGGVFKYKKLLNLQSYLFPLRPLGLISELVFSRKASRLHFIDALLTLPVRIFRYIASVNSPLSVIEIDLSKLSLIENTLLFDKHHKKNLESALKNLEAIRWRYNRDSNRTYKVFGVVSKSDNELRALIPVRIINIGEFNGAFIMDTLGEIPTFRLRTMAWLNIFHCIYKSGDTSAMIFLSNTYNSGLKQWNSFPWVKVPSKLMPQQIPVYFHGLESDQESFRFAHITLADFDMF